MELYNVKIEKITIEKDIVSITFEGGTTSYLKRECMGKRFNNIIECIARNMFNINTVKAKSIITYKD